MMAAAAATFMSTQIAQAITIAEGIQLINQGADEVEPHSSDAADRLRAVASDLGSDDGRTCPVCPPPPCPNCG